MALPINLATDDVIDETWTDAVVDTLTTLANPTPWVPILSPGLLVNNWVPTAGGYLMPGYRLVGDVVQVRGQVKSGTGILIFTLPVGLRPPGTFTLPGDTNAAYGQLTVTASGDVRGPIGSTNFSINFQFSVTP